MRTDDSGGSGAVSRGLLPAVLRLPAPLGVGEGHRRTSERGRDAEKLIAVPSPRRGEGPGERADELLRAAGRGDETAFAELYDLVAPRVYGLARRILRDPGQAEEVAQEAMVEVWQTATRFDTAAARPSRGFSRSAPPGGGPRAQRAGRGSRPPVGATFAVQQQRVDRHRQRDRVTASQQRLAQVASVLAAPDVRVWEAAAGRGRLSVAVSEQRNAAVAVMEGMPRPAAGKCYQFWRMRTTFRCRPACWPPGRRPACS